MKIISITAGWSETISLGNYNNVKPSLTLTAALDEGDDPVLVRNQLVADCKVMVRNEIDLTLEMHGQPMLYYTGPLYQVMWSRLHESVVILSNDSNRWPAGFSHIMPGSRALRLERAQLLAANKAGSLGFQVFDCTYGDFSAVEARGAEIEAARAAAEAESVAGGFDFSPEGLADHGDYDNDDEDD